MHLPALSRQERAALVVCTAVQYRVQDHPMQVDTCHMHGRISEFGKEGWASVVLLAAEVGQMTSHTLLPFQSSPCSGVAVPDTTSRARGTSWSVASIAPSAD